MNQENWQYVYRAVRRGNYSVTGFRHELGLSFQEASALLFAAWRVRGTKETKEVTKRYRSWPREMTRA